MYTCKFGFFFHSLLVSRTFSEVTYLVPLRRQHISEAGKSKTQPFHRSSSKGICRHFLQATTLSSDRKLHSMTEDASVTPCAINTQRGAKHTGFEPKTNPAVLQYPISPPGRHWAVRYEETSMLAETFSSLPASTDAYLNQTQAFSSTLNSTMADKEKSIYIRENKQLTLLWFLQILIVWITT